MRKILMGFSLAFILGLAACSNTSIGHPASTNQIEATSQVQDAEADIPSPSAEDAVITGMLLEGTDILEPADKAILYLADIIESTDGQKAAASFDRGSSPNTQTNASGRFVFVDVEPGEYALVLDRVYNSFLLQDPDGQGDLLFTVEAGEVLNLGRLEYLSLPESNFE